MSKLKLSPEAENKNMDLVYILGSGSKWKNRELRYSLRSVEKFLPHSKVFIVGERPEWLTNITHIPATDAYGHKLKNAIGKIRAACLDRRVSDNFILMNDDFFFLREVDKIEAFTLGTIDDCIRDHKTHDGYYYKAMLQTRALLQETGFERAASYEVHYPIVFNKWKFLQMTHAIKWEETGYLFRSVYGNVFGIGSKERKDTKLYNTSPTDLGLDRKNPDLISISDRVALLPKFQKWIDAKFPALSIYELYDEE